MSVTITGTNLERRHLRQVRGQRRRHRHQQRHVDHRHRHRRDPPASSTSPSPPPTGRRTWYPPTISPTRPRPSITSVAPNSGPTTGTTSVVIHGSGFTGVTGVKFGGRGGVVHLRQRRPDHGHLARRVGGHRRRPGHHPGRHLAHRRRRPVHLRRPCPRCPRWHPMSGPLGGGTSVVISGRQLQRGQRGERRDVRRDAGRRLHGERADADHRHLAGRVGGHRRRPGHAGRAGPRPWSPPTNSPSWRSRWCRRCRRRRGPPPAAPA